MKKQEHWKLNKQTDLLDKKIGTPLFRADSNASSPHGYQSTLKKTRISWWNGIRIENRQHRIGRERDVDYWIVSVLKKVGTALRCKSIGVAVSHRLTWLRHGEDPRARRAFGRSYWTAEVEVEVSDGWRYAAEWRWNRGKNERQNHNRTTHHHLNFPYFLFIFVVIIYFH